MPFWLSEKQQQRHTLIAAPLSGWRRPAMHSHAHQDHEHPACQLLLYCRGALHIVFTVVMPTPAGGNELLAWSK